MISSQTCRLLLVISQSSCLSKLAVSTQSSFCCKSKAKFNKLLMPSLKKTTLHQTYLFGGSSKMYRWLKREERKDYCLTTEEFKAAVENHKIYVVDVREPFEVAQGRVPAKHFVNIPMGIVFRALSLTEEEFEKHFDVPKPQKNDEVVFMCKSGIRSTFCLGAAQDLDFKKSKHYLGGWQEWESNYPQLKK